MGDPQPIHVEPLFATPLVIDWPAELAARLPSLAMAIGRRGSSLASSVDVPPLVTYVRSLASRMTEDVARAGRSIDWRISVTSRTAEDRHAVPIDPIYDAFWQALYIVEDGGADGRMILADPRLPSPMMEMPDLRLRMQRGRDVSLYAPDIAIPVTAGTLLMMPGWMQGRWHPPSGPGQRSLLTMAIVAPLVG
ncbi:hypothetical protein Q5H91_07015 [Sphingomonas sp. KR1UV-12]|uniref:Uncharacterized protein n=1 Tax=Sphingomonas aurea TaxID=3063994 RepID=A0ABT9EJI4_9SPHN|nr:hypothetical protein [Sphingomonas sp. KR1UV-12]MDP1026956.1 hypothetical protein [Sphingomonas sp. KR1UV-12]